MEPEVRERFEQIEAILEFVARRQAEAERRADRADERMAKFEARMGKFEVRMAKTEARADRMEARFEKRVEAINKLILTGMRMLVRIGGRIDELAKSQKVTDQKLQAFIDSLRKGGNGRRA